MRKLVLVSKSPRRLELLSKLGVKFEQVAPSEEVEVSEGPCADPCALAKGNALAKASTVASRFPNSVVVAFDTVVYRDGYAYGKPKDASDAARMLRELSGGWHEVHTAVAAIDTSTGMRVVGCEGTRVKFKELTEREVEVYSSTPEVLDKAGAYAIQGLASLLVERIEGDYFNVVGLPLFRLRSVLLRFGVDLFEEAARAAEAQSPGSAEP